MKTKTSDTSGNRGIILSGKSSLKTRNLAVGDGARITDNSLTDTVRVEAAREAIAKIESIAKVLPLEMDQKREDITALTGVLRKEIETKTPNSAIWQVTTNGLLDAAKAVGGVAPSLIGLVNSLKGLFLG